jgi:hypothetical protein
MNVPLPKKDVLLPMKLDLSPIIRIEQNPIPKNYRPNPRPNPHSHRPGKPPSHRSRSRNDKPGRRLPFPLGPFTPYENTVVQHPDGQAGFGAIVATHAVKRYARFPFQTAAGMAIRGTTRLGTANRYGKGVGG